MILPLFDSGLHTLHSLTPDGWRINTEGLCFTSVDTVALLIAEAARPFGRVEGVPPGGLLLADALRPYATPGHPLLLIVNDVYRTGEVIEEYRAGRMAKGWVVWDRSRGHRPAWISALWRYDNQPPTWITL